jgi:hypothetical protein
MSARRPVQHCMSTLICDDEYVLQHIWSYKPYASDGIHPFGADQKIFQYLAGVKHLTESRMCHFFLEAYHFSCWVVKPLRSVLLSQASST